MLGLRPSHRHGSRGDHHLPIVFGSRFQLGPEYAADFLVDGGSLDFVGYDAGLNATELAWSGVGFLNRLLMQIDDSLSYFWVEELVQLLLVFG